MVSKPDLYNGVPMSTKDIDALNRVINLIGYYAATDMPQQSAIEMYESYAKAHPEEDEPRDKAIASCAIMSVKRMLEELVGALKNAKPNG